MLKRHISLTRQQLYEQVWAEPTLHVANRLGLSDRGLGKLCARHDIPVPPRGWWAKKQHGHSVRQIALPPSAEGRQEIDFYPDSRGAHEKEPPEVEREKGSQWLITVSEELPITSPLLKQAAAAIRKQSKGTDHSREARWHDRYQAKLAKPGPGYLDIAVSRASLPRALRIMQALLAAFDRRGFAMRIGKDSETFAVVLDEPLQIALIERLRRVTVKYSYGTGTELEPSGRLMLRIGSTYQNAGIIDTPSRPVEKGLNRFVLNLVRRALEAKRERAIKTEKQARWRLHDEKARLAQQIRDSEELRRRRLASAAVRWTRHQRRCAFLKAVETRIRDGATASDNNAERWLEWAVEFVKESDPVGELLKEPWPTAPLREASPMPWNWD